jgi:hypothetical protein
MHVLIRRSLVIVGAAVVLAGGGATAAGATSASIIRSNNLAGYVTVPSSGGTTTAWREAYARFTVPKLNCAVTPNASVYHYAGVGGYKQTGMEGATGIVESCSSGSASYYGTYWYNYYGTSYGPEGDYINLNPGDSVSVSVTVVRSAQTVTFTVSDHTTGTYWQNTLTGYAYLEGSLNSAEVFSYGNIASEGTADFGSINFTGAGVVPLNGPSAQKHRPLSDPALWGTAELAQKGPVTQQIDIKPSVITGGSFTNTWLRPN